MGALAAAVGSWLSSSPPPQSQTEVEVHCCSSATTVLDPESEEEEAAATPHSRRSGGSTPLRRRRRTHSVEFFEPPGLAVVEPSPRVGYGRGDDVYKYLRRQQVSDERDPLRLPISASGNGYRVGRPPVYQAHPLH